MNLKDLQNYYTKSEKPKAEIKNNGMVQPSYFSKSLASGVDTIIVTFVRIIIGVFLASIVYKLKLKEIAPLINPNSPNLMEDLIKTGFLFYIGLIVITTIILGGMYYVISWSSKHSATLGQRFCHIKVVDKKDFTKISLARSFVRYICFLVPIFLIVILVQKYLVRQMDLSFFLIALTVFLWYDFGMFFRSKIGMPDIITKTTLISTKPKK